MTSCNPFSTWQLVTTWAFVACLAGFLFADATIAQQPNIILINLDDADSELFSGENLTSRFPAINSIAQSGLMLTNCHATTPLCGPSRACLLRAQYAHRSGIRVNQPEASISFGLAGGMSTYLESGYFENDLSTWMQDAGYRTMMVGKFLHSGIVRHVPGGWDDFRSYLGGKYYNTLVFSNETHADGRSHILPENVYRTEAEFNDAISLINKHVAANAVQPFFLFLNPFGPHRQQKGSGPMIDEAKYGSLWPDVTIPLSPAYNEADVSDGNGPLSELPLLTTAQHDLFEIHHRERLIATKSVDDMVGQLLRLLDRKGIRDNTYIFITSDNGFTLGHHRAFSKGFTTDRTTRVPLIVTGPGVTENNRSDQLLAHIDLGPTIVELAGGETPGFADGKSFAHILSQPELYPVDEVRNHVLIENFESRKLFGRQLDLAGTSLRLPNGLYTEWADGGREYFNFGNDPEQLENVYYRIPREKRNFYAGLIRRAKSTIQPYTGFQTPFKDGESLSYPIKFKGIAESNSSIFRVELAIQHEVTRKFWNGSEWVAEFSRVKTKLGGHRSQLSIWDYDFAPESHQQEEGNLRVWAWAFGPGGSYAPPTRRAFSATREVPTLSLNTPGFKETLNVGTDLLGGSAIGIADSQVAVAIRDIHSKRYWNGASFQTTRHTFNVAVSGTTWSLSPNLPAGSFRTFVNAVDVEGNSFPQIVRLFYVE